MNREPAYNASVPTIVTYLKNKNVPRIFKIYYLIRRNKYMETKAATNELNNVKVTNIFNGIKTPMRVVLSETYHNSPTILRILQQPERNALSGAYGRMLHHNVPMNVIRRIQTLVGNKTNEKAILKANSRMGIQSLVNNMRRRKNNKYWGNLIGRTHASPKRILK